MSRKVALLIGNSTYGPGLPSLEKPDADIAALAKVLGDPAIGGFDEVKPLFDATSATVRLEVARFFSGRSPDDLLLLYFSGHGLRNDRGGLYLAVQDTETALLSGTAVPAAFISEEMDNCRSRRQILILDCCYSGAFERGAKGPASNPATAFRGNGLGRFVLTASDSTQLAWEDVAATSTEGLSVFTRHLVGGLESGEADLDGDGLISVDELYDYVYARVVEENPRQTPGKSASKQQGEIFLARNPTGPKLRPLPAELIQALEHPLATVREGAVRELERFLRGSDVGLAKAARKAVEQACDDDSRRVAKVAAEILATVVSEKPEPAPKPQPASFPTNDEGRHSPGPPIFSAGDSSEPPDVDRSLRESDAGPAEAAPAMRESIPLQESAPQSQPVPAPKSGEERSTAPAQSPSIKDSPSTLYILPRGCILWVILAFFAFIIVMVIIGIANSKPKEVEEEAPAAVTDISTQPGTSQTATAETSIQPDTSQALLTEAKSWPLVLFNNFDSAASASSFTDRVATTEECNKPGYVSKGVLHWSVKTKSRDGCGSYVSAGPATATADFYLRVELRKSLGPDNAEAGLLFRIDSDWRYYAFNVYNDGYSLGVLTAEHKWKFLWPRTTSAAIQPGQANSLAVIARQSDLIFFINDQKVGQVSDSTLSSGAAGLFVESYDTNEVAFDFDNFELRRRPEAPGAPPAGK